MKFRFLAAAAAAVTMAATPAIAADRVSAPVEGESEIGGGVSIIVALLAAAAVIGGIFIAVDNGDDDAVSP
ncbi:hypothetical protein A9995_08225 [Erythrobacter sp. QSSC1-22B]|uniref:hypothetical protein n=1 Tax=Erythrobacter sp. QSSC1-22B TaxID=1860125 RepID=UPI00080597CC|nr:hypothetical protein [Erythrobacter sp. QSSC1-22B]OBX19118.1 hypothetical protein A9995_08225 [Erythrobacter sp. QSSC1-22B]